jgi:hypothetical protein
MSRLTEADATMVVPVVNNRVRETDEVKSVLDGVTSPAGAPENSVTIGSR